MVDLRWLITTKRMKAAATRCPQEKTFNKNKKELAFGLNIK